MLHVLRFQLPRFVYEEITFLRITNHRPEIVHRCTINQQLTTSPPSDEVGSPRNVFHSSIHGLGDLLNFTSCLVVYTKLKTKNMKSAHAERAQASLDLGRPYPVAVWHRICFSQIYIMLIFTRIRSFHRFPLRFFFSCITRTDSKQRLQGCQEKHFSKKKLFKKKSIL